METAASIPFIMNRFEKWLRASVDPYNRYKYS